jgi:adenylosuccinate synthase
MTHKIYIVTDLGPGDGGKGGVVHKVATMMRAHTVIKAGGAQGSHGVCTSRGERFAFSQWGCGTFEGIRTYLSQRMIVSPVALLNEAEALRYQHGIYDPFELLTIDSRALCATPYHGISSRLKEMARGNRPRGTIGTGVGEAFRYSREHPELTILASDVARPDLVDILFAIRERIREDLEEIITGDFLESDLERANQEIDHLYDDGFLEYVEDRFRLAAKLTKIVDPEYFKEHILEADGVAVFETSHGVLTDNLFGFHPHTSAIRTLPLFNQQMLKEAGYTGQIVNLGVTRAYQIRHGAGPMPTADQAMGESLLPGSHKEENRYQGKIRVGPLDLVLLRYALEVAGGPEFFDGLAVTWFDQVRTNGRWHLCHRYNNGPPGFFLKSGEINHRKMKSLEAQYRYQEALGQVLSHCEPALSSYDLSKQSQDKLFALCADTLKEFVGVPVRMVSFGPTEQDKTCK